MKLAEKRFQSRSAVVRIENKRGGILGIFSIGISIGILRYFLGVFFKEFFPPH